MCEQLAELRTRLEAKDRAVDFGIEVMGRVDLGLLDDIVDIAARLPCDSVIDFAHMHATTDGS